MSSRLPTSRGLCACWVSACTKWLVSKSTSSVGVRTPRLFALTSSTAAEREGACDRMNIWQVACSVSRTIAMASSTLRARSMKGRRLMQRGHTDHVAFPFGGAGVLVHGDGDPVLVHAGEHRDLARPGVAQVAMSPGGLPHEDDGVLAHGCHRQVVEVARMHHAAVRGGFAVGDERRATEHAFDAGEVARQQVVHEVGDGAHHQTLIDGDRIRACAIHQTATLFEHGGAGVVSRVLEVRLAVAGSELGHHVDEGAPNRVRLDGRDHLTDLGLEKRAVLIAHLVGVASEVGHTDAVGIVESHERCTLHELFVRVDGVGSAAADAEHDCERGQRGGQRPPRVLAWGVGHAGRTTQDAFPADMSTICGRSWGGTWRLQ